MSYCIFYVNHDSLFTYYPAIKQASFVDSSRMLKANRRAKGSMIVYNVIQYTHERRIITTH